MIRNFSFVFAVLSLATAVSAEDQVYRKGQPLERGLVSKMSKTEVTLTSSGVEREIPANEIQRISFDDEPSELSNIRRDALEGNYKSAFAELKKVDTGKINREVVKQEVEFLSAFCEAKLAMTEGGNKESAEKSLRDFCTRGRDNYHFYTAAELLGDVASSAGKYADAAKYYAAVTNAPWAETKARTTVALGRMLAAQGEYPEAMKKFDEVANAPGMQSTEPYKQQAHVGRAVCLAETDKAAEAITLLAGDKGIIATNDPQDSALMARAYNALGSAYLKTGEKKQAILAFLHTDLLYFREPDAHAEALYHLTSLWQEVNKADRAIEASNTLKQRYSGSYWASKK